MFSCLVLPFLLSETKGMEERQQAENTKIEHNVAEPIENHGTLGLVLDFSSLLLSDDSFMGIVYSPRLTQAKIRP
jgi:hypothetical protein